MAIEKKEGMFEHLCSVKRVTRVVAGGKISRVSTLMIVGDRAGKVGFGKGKAVETPEAARKAGAMAQKNMKAFPLYRGRTIHHDVEATFGATKVILRRAKAGVGLIVGAATRSIFEALGVTDIVAKIYGSKNPLNIVRATLAALEKIRSAKQIAAIRGIDRSELFLHRRDVKTEQGAKS